MSTQAQASANAANAQQSTGPKTSAGKAASSRNHFSHGLTGTAFQILDWEDQNAFHELSLRLELEHKPANVTEEILVQKMAQHYWLTQRAITLQGTCFSEQATPDDPENQLALYLRYQATHGRAFHKSLDQLLKLRAEKCKQEIGFESQKQKQADQTRRNARQETAELRKQADQIHREATETRKQELHSYAVLLAGAKADNQLLQNINLRGTMTAACIRENRPLPAELAA